MARPVNRPVSWGTLVTAEEYSGGRLRCYAHTMSRRSPTPSTPRSLDPSISIRPPSGVNLIAFGQQVQEDVSDLPLVGLNLAQSAIDVHLQGNSPPPCTLADQGQGVVECRGEMANGCTVQAGTWIDPYTGRTFTAAGDLNVDHIVPLKHAHEAR